jgi:hypothetical protein
MMVFARAAIDNDKVHIVPCGGGPPRDRSTDAGVK